MAGKGTAGTRQKYVFEAVWWSRAQFGPWTFHSARADVCIKMFFLKKKDVLYVLPTHLPRCDLSLGRGLMTFD